MLLLAALPLVWGAPTPRPPNVVLVLTDDLDLSVTDRLPGLASTLGNAGTTFTNHFVSLSLCCPSRSSILRGQYAHDTGVFGNHPPSGGYQVFHDSHDEADTLAVWLQSGGYRTALYGKYLNGYPGREGETAVPPGWSDWAVPVRGNAYQEFNYTLNEGGRLVEHGDRPRDYLTDVLSDKAEDFVTRSAADGVPFFLYLSTFAPHAPFTPAPRYEDAFPDAVAPRTPSFNEADVSDKPSWLRGVPLLGDRALARLDRQFRRRLQSMLAVQDLVDHLVSTLERTGQLDNTYLVFTSDNGFHLGQHRLIAGKNTAFDTDIHVPLFIRGPGVPAGHTVDALTVNVDFAPTIAGWAGVPVPAFVEGRSLTPLWTGGTPSWRQAVLLEHAGPDALDLDGNADGSGLHEPPDSEDAHPGNGTNQVPVFAGLRTAERTYVHYADGQEELYDDRADPDQLVNLAATADPAELARLRAWTAAMTTCHGAECRAREEHAP